MSSGLINLLVVAVMIVIIAAVVSVFYVAATRRGGRKGRTSAKPSRAHNRKINPKTGDLFP
jgi:heme/copper-type cytochrome/quinol oxidase subunit 2